MLQNWEDIDSTFFKIWEKKNKELYLDRAKTIIYTFLIAYQQHTKYGETHNDII